MFFYKDLNQLIEQFSNHDTPLSTILQKVNNKFEQNLNNEQDGTNNNNLDQKLFYQIDLTLLFNPDRDLLLSILNYFDQFCSSKFPISTYPFYIYRQIIKIGYEKIYDSQIISRVLSILFYICSSLEKSILIDLQIIPFILKIIDFYFSLQLRAHGQNNEQFPQVDESKTDFFDSDLKNNKEQNQYNIINIDIILSEYSKCFNYAVIFLTCLASIFESNINEFKDVIFKLFDIASICLSEPLESHDFHQREQDPENFISFSYIFKYLYIIISHFHFCDDEMIPVNQFFLCFLTKTNLEFYNRSLLETIYCTKSWQLNIFNIFNNDILINYLKNCFLFFNQSFQEQFHENSYQEQNEFDNNELFIFLKYTLKNIFKINFPYPEIFEINFDVLKCPSSYIFLSIYLKCVEKSLKMNISPTDLCSIFDFSFSCLQFGEYKIQKSSIGVIFALSKICVNCFYKRIIENLLIFTSFIENGNRETIFQILNIVINVIRFCNANDQLSLKIIIEELIKQDFLQIIFDDFGDTDDYDHEIDDLSKYVKQSILKYKTKASNL